MNDDANKMIAKTLKLAAWGLLVFPLMMTFSIVFTAVRRQPQIARPIFVGEQGMYEYDWDPTDPDFTQESCERYKLRQLALFDSTSAEQMGEDQLEKSIADSCDEARKNARKHRKLLEKLK